MQNRTFKVVSYDPKTNLQGSKRVYTSEKDFLRYKDDVIRRYRYHLIVKTFELIDDVWVSLNTYPCDKIS
jgi:hypothetical protein